MDWQSAVAAAVSIDWRIVVLAIGAVVFAQILQALRAKLILSDASISVRRLFFIRNAGQGLNHISPIRIVGDATEMVLLCKGHGVRPAKALALAAVSRLIDFLVTVSMVGVGLLVLPQLAGFRPVVAPLWLVVGLATLTLVFLGDRVHRIPVIWRFALLTQTLEHIAASGSRRRMLAFSILLTIVSWLSIGTAAWLVANAAGVELPFWLMCIIIVAVTFFATTTPAPPAAIGVYEFGAVATLGLFAIDPSAALTFAIVIHAIVVLPAVLIGLPTLLVERWARRARLAPTPAPAPIA